MSSLADSLDYTPLQQPVTAEDIAAYKQFEIDYKLKQQSVSGARALDKKVLFIVLGIMALIFVPLAIMSTAGVVHMIISVVHGDSSASVSTFFLTALIVGIVVALGAVIRHHRRRLAKMYKFAAKNNIQLHVKKRTLLPAEYSGLIFDEGHSQSVNEGYVFADNTEIGNYRYVTGSGKNQQTHLWMYARIKLTRRLPNMVLDARANNLFGRISNLPDSFHKDQTLSLEGDFNKHFTLYAPKEYETDALYVFTPDVMVAVIDAGKAYDMEVIDDNLMLYAKGRIDLTKEQQLRPLLHIIDTIASELKDQSKRYVDERVGDRTMNIVAEPGRRLKSKLGWGAILTIILFVVYIVASAMNMFS
jgi:hypothetical protein